MSKEDSSRIQSTQVGSIYDLSFSSSPPPLLTGVDRDHLRQRLAMTLAQARLPPVRNQLATNKPTPRRKVPAAAAAATLPGALPAAKLKVKRRNERY